MLEVGKYQHHAPPYFCITVRSLRHVLCYVCIMLQYDYLAYTFKHRVIKVDDFTSKLFKLLKDSQCSNTKVILIFCEMHALGCTHLLVFGKELP